MQKVIPNPQCDSVTLMNLYDQEVREFPGVPDRKTLLLRARLNLEETLEFVKACGCEIGLCGDGSILDKDTLQVFIDESIEPDLVEMVDAIGDIQVVNLGAACALGVDVQPVWNEIQRSNMSKMWPYCSECGVDLHDTSDPRWHPYLGQKNYTSWDDPHGGMWSIEYRLRKREDGKILKPPSYSPADVQKVLDEQTDRYLQNLPHEVANAA